MVLQFANLTFEESSTDLFVVEPDRSNPTRHRMERPLDTIRAFHAAAESTCPRALSNTGGLKYRAADSRVLISPWSPPEWNGDMHCRTSYYPQNRYPPRRSWNLPSGAYYFKSSYVFASQSTVAEFPGAFQMYGRPVVRQHTYRNAAAQNHYPNSHRNSYSTGQTPVFSHGYQHPCNTKTSNSDEYGISTGPRSQNRCPSQLHQLRTKPTNHSPEILYTDKIRIGQSSLTIPFTPCALGDGGYGQTIPISVFDSVSLTANKVQQPIKLTSSATTDSTPPTAPMKKGWIKSMFSRRDHPQKN